MEYIFTDLIRFRNKKGLLFEGSIVQEYLTQLDKDFPLNFVDFHLLQKIFLCSDSAMVIFFEAKPR